LPWLDLVLPISEAIPGSDVVTTSLHAELRLQLLGSAVVTAFGMEAAHPAQALLKPWAHTPGGRYAVIAMGAGDPIRCWPTERYGELGRALVDRHGLDIVIIGGPSDRNDVLALAALLPQGRVQTVIAMPLTELPPLLAGAALCVCNGSGISHLSAALRVPTVCVIGGTTRMEVWHPAGAHAISVGARTPCQPCGLRLASECPWNVACLTAVETGHVLAACEELLEAFDTVSYPQAI
jgi:ADP-heptose:LPS heptosyltransferase